MASQTIPRTSLHDELVDLIRNMITEGELPVGERISEIALCDRFGVSRTPLREALKVLANEGLVGLLQNRGAVVARLEVSDVDDIFPVIGALEGLAGELACRHASDEQIAEIRRLHREMVQHFSENDLPGYFKLNQMIHEKIIEASGNATLRLTHRALTMRVRRVRYLSNDCGRAGSRRSASTRKF